MIPTDVEFARSQQSSARLLRRTRITQYDFSKWLKLALYTMNAISIACLVLVTLYLCIDLYLNADRLVAISNCSLYIGVLVFLSLSEMAYSPFAVFMLRVRTVASRHNWHFLLKSLALVSMATGLPVRVLDTVGGCGEYRDPRSRASPACRRWLYVACVIIGVGYVIGSATRGFESVADDKKRRRWQYALASLGICGYACAVCAVVLSLNEVPSLWDKTTGLWLPTYHYSFALIVGIAFIQMTRPLDTLVWGFMART